MQIKQNGRLIELTGVRDRILGSYFEDYQKIIREKKYKIAFVHFTEPDWLTIKEEERDRLKSEFNGARISYNRKKETFIKMGFQILHTTPLNFNISSSQLQKIILNLNQDQNIKGFMVIYPMPKQLQPLLNIIAPQKDIDCQSEYSIYQASAILQTISKVLHPFLNTEAVVALIGKSEQYIGTGLMKLLKKQPNIKKIIQIQQQKLFQSTQDILDADIIITLLNIPNSIDEKVLRPYHRVIIDGAFTTFQGKPTGDVKIESRKIPQYVTPVPGGIAALQNVILFERIMKDVMKPNWKLTDFIKIQYKERTEF